MKTQYSYAIIKHNYPELAQINTFFDCKHKARAKYAMLLKTVHKDGSETVTHIKYSNDILALHEQAKLYHSWYNYPIGVFKSIQGYLHETTC